MALIVVSSVSAIAEAEPPAPDVCAVATRGRSAALRKVLDTHRQHFDLCRQGGGERPADVLQVRLHVKAGQATVCLPQPWAKTRFGQCVQSILQLMAYPEAPAEEVLDFRIATSEAPPPPPPTVILTMPPPESPTVRANYAYKIAIFDILSLLPLIGFAFLDEGWSDTGGVLLTSSAALSVLGPYAVHLYEGNYLDGMNSLLMRLGRLSVGASMAIPWIPGVGGPDDTELALTVVLAVTTTVPILLFDYFIFSRAEEVPDPEAVSIGPVISTGREGTVFGLGGRF